MKLATPGPTYSPSITTQNNAAIERADAENLKRGKDARIQSPARLILYSPNGQAWQITVSDLGILSAVSTT